MTKTLLKLQLTLWGRTIKGNKAAIVMMSLISFYALMGLFGFGIFLALGLGHDHMGILAGVVSVGMVAYCIAAFMWPSGEGQLDPTAFSTMPLSAKQLLPGFAISTLLQSRGIIAVICTVATSIIAAVFLPVGSWPMIVFMMAVSLVTTLLLGELLGALTSGSSSRVSNDRRTVLTSVVFMVFVVGYNMLIGADRMSRIDAIGAYTKWTPFGAGAGAIEAFAVGLWGEAGLLTLLAFVYVAAGFWLWSQLINRALTAPLDQGGQGQSAKDSAGEGKKVLFLPGIPWSVGGAIFSRSLRYMFRDSRLLGSMIVFPLLGVLFIFQSFTVEFFMIYVGLIMMAVFAGSVATNDFGYDGPSLWLNIVAGVKARTLLMPRHWASMLPGSVSIVVFMIITIVLAENKTTAVLICFIGLGIFISSAAVALLVTTFNPYPTSKPGTSPWGYRSGYSGAAFVGAFAALLLGWIPTIPTIALGIFGLVTDQMWMIILAEVLAIILPVAVYIGVAKVCIRKVEKGLPEIFDKVKTHVK